MVAILLVEGMVGLFKLANRQAQLAVGYLESVSFAMIAVLGFVLMARGTRAFIAHLRNTSTDRLYGKRKVEPCSSCGHGHHQISQGKIEGREAGGSRLGLVLSIGIRPCSGAVLVLLLAHLLNMPLAGIGAAFAMSAGTGLVVSCLALTVLYAKKVAQSVIAKESRAIVFASHVFSVLGGIVIALLGAVLFQGSLVGSHPIL